MTDRGMLKADASLACPFVAYEDDRDARSDHADHRHRCYAEVRPAPRATTHQETYCLTAAFGACPTFQDWARRESARVRWPSSTRSTASAETEPPRPRPPTPPEVAAPPPAGSGQSHATEDATPAARTGAAPAAAAGLASSRFLRPEDLADDVSPSHDRRTWAAPPPWSPGKPGETEPPTFLAAREPLPPSPADTQAEQELLPAVEEWPEPEPTIAPGATTRRRRERIDADGPSWEEPRRYEAFPTIKSRVGMPSLSRPLVGLIVLVAAAGALFLLPGFLPNGNDGGGAVASPSPSTSVTPTPSPSPEPSPTPLTYVVKKGDTMTKIAKAHGVTLEALVAANKETVKDPNKVKVGDELIIPVPPAEEPSSSVSEEPSAGSEEPSP